MAQTVLYFNSWLVNASSTLLSAATLPSTQVLKLFSTIISVKKKKKEKHIFTAFKLL